MLGPQTSTAGRYAYPSVVAAAQSAWYIDPTNGSDSATGLSGHPIKTWAEYRRRVGALPVATSTITLLGNLPATDTMQPPFIAVGAGVTVTITGSPAAVTLATATVTATTAISRSSNTASNISASGLSANWSSAGTGGVSLVGAGKRGRITSGARAGVTFWPCKDTATKSARISQPLVPFPTTTAAVLVITDPFVVEALPTVGDLAFDQPVAGYITGTANLIFEGLDFTPCGSAQVPAVGVFGAIVFQGCEVGSLEGSYEAIGCAFEEYASCYSGYKTAAACLFRGDVQIQGGTLYTSTGTLSQGGGPWVFSAGVIVATDLGIFDSSGAGIDVSGQLTQAVLWGAGNTTYGVAVHPGGSVTWTSQPTITGTTNNANVGGTAKTWAAINAAGFAGGGASAYPYV